MSEAYTARARLRMMGAVLAGLAVAACGGGGGSPASPPAPLPPPPLPPPPPPPPAALKQLYQPNFLVGAAVQAAQVGGATQDRTLLQAHMNSITAEYEMKADQIKPAEPGPYNFGPGDALASYCQANATQLRGHALVWHQTTPAWFLTGGASAVRAKLEAYIAAVAGRYANQIYAWDVVNEVVADDAGAGGLGYRNSNWFQAVGADYIEWAFRAARLAAPNCKLFINDYSTEITPKRDRLLAIVRDLLNKGVPVDGIGHQFHLQSGITVAQVDAALAAVDAFNATYGTRLEQHVTELDVSIYPDPAACFSGNTAACLPETSTPSQAVLSQQATFYRALFNTFRGHASVKSVTLWGISDAQTWLNNYPVAGRDNHPLLWDRNRNPKTAFNAVADASYVIP